MWYCKTVGRTERSLHVIGWTSLGMPDQLCFRSSSEITIKIKHTVSTLQRTPHFIFTLSKCLAVLFSYPGQCWDKPAAAWICPAGSFPAPSWAVLLTHSGLRCEPPVGWLDGLGETAASAGWSGLWRVRQAKWDHPRRPLREYFVWH